MTQTTQLLAFFLVASLASGCAPWKSISDTKSILVKPKPSPTSSILDIAFIPLPIRDDQVDWRLWNDADEQVLPDQTRKALAMNGLRAGRIDGELPDVVTSELAISDTIDDGAGDLSAEPLQFLAQANLLSDMSHGARRIHCRTATRYELPVRAPMQGDISLLLREGEHMIGHTLTDPLFQFSMETKTGSDGQMILRLVPEVQHGGVKQAWVSKEQALRLDARRDVHVFDHLAIEIPLQAGQGLLVSPTAIAVGLGEKMFMGDRVDAQLDVTALFIRMTKEPSELASSK